MGGVWIMSQHIPEHKSRSDLGNLHELRGKRLVAQVSQTRRSALYSRTGLVLMLQLESSLHGRSGFDDSIGVFLAWEWRGSCLNIFRTKNHGRISETFTNYGAKRLVAQVSQTRRFANQSGFDAPIGVVLAWETFTNYESKDLLRKSMDIVSTYSERQITVGSQKPSRMMRQKTCCASDSNTSVRDVYSNRSGFDAPIGVFLAWEERGSCLNIFRTINRGRISETFTNYEPKDLLRKNLHELRGKRLVAQVSQTRRFANGFDSPIGVVLAWEERGSCLNIFRMKNRGWISETFTNYEAKDLLRKVVLMLQLESSWHGRSVDHVSTYFGTDKSRSDLRNLHELRGKKLVAQVSQTRWFAYRSGFDAPIGVVLAWEERGSCLNIFRTTNSGRISETFTNYEAKDSLRKSVDHVSTYSGRKIAVGSQKPSPITRQKNCCASESNTSVRVVFENRSGLAAPIGVFLAWDERWIMSQHIPDDKSSLISETFTIYEAKYLLRNVDKVSTYSGQQIAAGSQKLSRITRQKTCCASEPNTSVRVLFANQSGFDAPIGVVFTWEERGSCLNIPYDKSQSDLRNLANYEAKDLLRKQKTCYASESNTSVLEWFDAPIGVVLAWEERGSCLNIFRTTNRGRISETFMNYEAKDLLRKNLHELRGKRLVAQVCQTHRFALYSLTGVVFDATIGVVLAWEERGSCLNIFRTTNRGRISETFTNYEAKDLLPQVSQTRRFALYSLTGVFDATIGVVLAWEERGSCLNIFGTTNRGAWIMSQHIPDDKSRSDLRNLHELRGKRLVAQVLSNTSVRVVFANRSGFDAPIGVVLAWEERGSCLNIFRMKNRANQSGFDAPIESSWHGRSVDHVSTYSGRQSRSDLRNLHQLRGKDLLRSESNSSVRVVLANQSGFDAPIGVVLA
ncbi:uncharacterized protein G2W53_033631 [Senna tora]|uniref:Uncharacterized protein n=1 Tax=Senna tora TaxID=362788 RepID=A0A834T0X8_9FABA|nr:uncharacterized protein G2W53_033631 [Senna tora]